MSLKPRQRLVMHLKLLTEVDLPKAAKVRQYPVHLDHCFKRIAFDNAVGAKWDTKVKAPFYRNASTPQLILAVTFAKAMLANPQDAYLFNNRSLGFRNKKPKPLASTIALD